MTDHQILVSQGLASGDSSSMARPFVERSALGVVTAIVVHDNALSAWWNVRSHLGVTLKGGAPHV